MELNQTNIIGIMASVFTGVSLIPQLYKIIKEKKSEIAPVMLAVLFLGNSFWIWYGCIKTDAIIVISNAFSVLINCIISFLSFRYRARK